MIQDSPWQCQHIVCFIKDKILLLIGSNDQTHLIDPNSLSEMKYHDCFDSFVCFFVTGYHHLQSPEKHCQQHGHRHQEVDFKHTCSPAHFFQLQRLVSSSHVADSQTLARMLLSRRKKQYIHSPSMTILQQLSFKSEKLKPKIMPHS